MGSSCSGDSSQRKIKTKETDGQQQRGKKSTTSLSLFMEAFGLVELSTMATQTWAEGTWIGKWYTEHKEA